MRIFFILGAIPKSLSVPAKLSSASPSVQTTPKPPSDKSSTAATIQGDLKNIPNSILTSTPNPEKDRQVVLFTQFNYSVNIKSYNCIPI